MNKNRTLFRIIGIPLVLILLAGCSTTAGTTTAPTTSAPTEAPPTATKVPPTPPSVPPTDTPTFTPIPQTATPTLPPQPIQYLNPRRYSVEYVVTVNNTGYNLNKLSLYHARPVEWDAQEDLTIEEVSPEPAAESTDEVHGNSMYYWELQGEPKSGEAQSFSIRFSFTAYETKTNFDPDEVEPYDENDPLYILYTKPERFLEANDPTIMRLAEDLAGEETNPYLIAQKYYDYIIDNIKDNLTGKGLIGARKLEAIKKGECGDYAALFVALCRAKGIPARPIVGYWAKSGLDQTHCWAEFYLKPFGWVPVDPTIGQIKARKYYFGNMDNQRVILNKNYNIKLEPPAPNGFIAPFLQGPWFWFWGSGNGNAVNIFRTKWEVKPLP